MTSAMTHQLKNQISYIYLLYSSIRYFLDLSIKYLIFFICFCEQNLQQQMKNLSYISYLKNSMMELVKNSTDSAEDQDEAEQQKQTYYREFIKMRKMKKCTINNVQTIPGMRFNRPYAVYHIAVVTTDFTYKVVKRYSEFEKLYGQCIKVMTFQQSFPQKTLWSSGYEEQITAIRQIQLNKIIQQINQEQTPDVVKYKFYQFINLYNKNEEFVANNKQQKYYNQQFILNSISQFHSLNKQTLHLFKDIENSMAQSKRKISYELSKQMLMGFNGNQGIIPFVLNNNNQLIVIAGLHLINWLFSPEMNKDSQIFNKVLQKMSPHFLLLQFYIDFKDSQIKIQYFQLLSIYLQLREDLTIQSICGNGEQEEMLREDYIKWANWKKVKEF